jgi:predicted MFS family arabinose efflux permease
VNPVLQLYRDAYSGLSRSIWLQSLVMLVNRAGTMVIPFLSIYLTSALHFSIAQAGTVLAVFGAGSILGVYVGGKVTDRIGFFPVQFWTLLVNGLLFLALGQLRGFWTISICIFLLASIGEAFRPANASAIVHYSLPENRTRSYSLNRLAINLGFAVGPALGGFLAGISYSLLFWTDGLTCILAALMLSWCLRPKESTPHRESHVAIKSDPPYRDKTYLRFIVLVWLFCLGFFQLFSMIPLYYKDVIHLSPSQIGMVLSMNGLLIACLEMVLVYRLENRRPNTRYIAFGVVLNVASFVVLRLGGPYGWVAVLSMLFVTFGEMMSLPYMNAYWIGRSHPKTRGQYAALYGIAWSAAQVAGPFLGAQVVQHWGFSWLWLGFAALGTLTSWGFRRLG